MESRGVDSTRSLGVPEEYQVFPNRTLQSVRSDRCYFCLGPARVLATELRIERGEVRQGSIVWLHSGGRLLKTAPEQLRRKSLHEQEVEERKGPVKLSWIFT